MRKKATGNTEQAIDAVPTVEPSKTRAPAKSVRAKATKVTKAADPSPAAKRPAPARISLAALAMGTAAVPAAEDSPAAKRARPAKVVGKAAPAVKSAEPVAKVVAKVAKASRTAKPPKSAKVTTGTDAASGTRRPIKGIRLASSLAGLANANPAPFVEEAPEVAVPPAKPAVALSELVLPSLSLETPEPVMEIRLPAPAEAAPPPVLVAARPRPQPARRWLMAGLALLAIALAGLVVTQFGAPDDDAPAPIAMRTTAPAPAQGGAVPFGPGPYRPAAYRPYPGADHGGHYIDNEGRAYGRYSRDSTHW